MKTGVNIYDNDIITSRAFESKIAKVVNEELNTERVLEITMF